MLHGYANVMISPDSALKREKIPRNEEHFTTDIRKRTPQNARASSANYFSFYYIIIQMGREEQNARCYFIYMYMRKSLSLPRSLTPRWPRAGFSASNHLLSLGHFSVSPAI